MNHSVKFSARTVVAAAVLSLGGAAFAAPTFDANIETNSVYKSEQGATKSSFSNGGRIELNVNAELAKTADYFVNAKGTIELGLNGGSDTNANVADAWIQFGNSAADLKIGRFEAVDLFPVGKDVVVERAIGGQGYNGNSLRGRFKDGSLHAALGLNAGAGLRLELGLIAKKDAVLGDTSGFRPAVVYSAGPLTLRAGMETTNSTTGYALSAGYAMNSSTMVNVNYANNNDTKLSSLGLNATFGAAGLGFIQDKNDVANVTVNTLYAAYSIPLFNVKGASVTPAFSYSTGTGVENLTAINVRLNYAF